MKRKRGFDGISCAFLVQRTGGVIGGKVFVVQGVLEKTLHRVERGDLGEVVGIGAAC